MTQEFNLSEKMIKSNHMLNGKPIMMLTDEDVKEFVRRLKEVFCVCGTIGHEKKCERCKIIDRLAGEELK